MKILVTGCAGFIGSDFCDFVLNNTEHTLVGVDKMTYAAKRENLPQEGARFSFYMTDICDIEKMENIFSHHKPDAVVHFAAESHVDRSISNASPFLKSNVEGTVNLLELCRKYPVKRFVMISTDEVYGSNDTDVPFNERRRLEPGNPYAASKAAAEMFCMAYHNTFGIPVVITRCVNNEGPHQHEEKLLPKAARAIKDGLPVRLYGSGLQERQWIKVRDHVEQVFQAMFEAKSGSIRNICLAPFPVNNRDKVKSMLPMNMQDDIKFVLIDDRIGHDRKYWITSCET
jgi:dTDP-glucose 4,6-dehydratase